MLWLLLISGAALKWAGLPASSSRIFGLAQIVLSSGVVVFGVVAVLINSGWAIAACRVRSTSSMQHWTVMDRKQYSRMQL